MQTEKIVLVLNRISNNLRYFHKDMRFQLSLTNPCNGRGETVVLEALYNSRYNLASTLPTIHDGFRDVLTKLQQKRLQEPRKKGSRKVVEQEEDFDLAALSLEGFDELVDEIAKIAAPVNELQVEPTTGHGRGPAFQIIISDAPAHARLQLWGLPTRYGDPHLGFAQSTGTSICFEGGGATLPDVIEAMVARAREYTENRPMSRCPTCGHATVSRT